MSNNHGCRDRKAGSTVLASIAFISTALLAGCGGTITRLELDPSTPTVCDPTSAVCGIRNDQEATFKVSGQGVCDSVGLRLGDGSTRFSGQHDFGKAGAGTPWVMKYTYKTANSSAWPGAKTVHAYSASNCAGEHFLRLNVLHPTVDASGQRIFRPYFALGFGQPTAQACNILPNTSPLRRNSKVFISTNPNQRVKINFGCAFGGCIYDADGEPNSSAPANFPFPGLRKYSLVLRVGGQVVQGGTRMNFTTNQGGPLEVCVNDDNLPDNTGAWGIDITVDETQAG